MRVARRPRNALLPALVFALFCTHLPANVIAREPTTPQVLGYLDDYSPTAITRRIPSPRLYFAKDSKNEGGGSSGSGKDDKQKKDKKEKDKRKDKDKKKDKDKDKCKDKHKEKNKDKCKKKDSDKEDGDDNEEEDDAEEGASDEQNDGDVVIADEVPVEPAVSSGTGASGAELTISGTPVAMVVALDRYSFTPATGNAGDSGLMFSISGRPLWADFDEITGELSGTPGEADVNLYQAIAISVSDGSSNASLAPFSIEVTAVGAATGSVTLNWTPPTENEDGTPLMDLASYLVYWGLTPGTHTHSMKIDNPGVSRVVVESLIPGTYEFVATAINTSGIESHFSNPVTKVVQ